MLAAEWIETKPLLRSNKANNLRKQTRIFLLPFSIRYFLSIIEIKEDGRGRKSFHNTRK